MNCDTERITLQYKGKQLTIEPSQAAECMYYKVIFPGKKAFFIHEEKRVGQSGLWLKAHEPAKLAEELGQLIETNQ